MTTMTMPTTVARTTRKHRREVSQLMPLLVALVLLAATTAVSLWISGPMH